MFRADPNGGNDEKLRKKMVLFDENMMSEIMNGFPNLIWTSVEVPAVEPDKSKSEPEPAAKEPEVQQPEVQKSAPETETEPPVPTQPSDKKVYDTITKTRYLTTMAKDHYGNYHLWPYIYQENEKILGHPDRIRPGTKVVVPPLSKYGVNPDNKADIDKAKKLGNEIYARYN